MEKIKCVLLIDDNIHDNYIHTFTIKKIDPGMTVNSVLSGEEALDYFEKSKKGEENYPFPELVFLDINMPGMNGFEFLEKAREKKIVNNGHPVVVIMLTSSLNPTDSRKAADDFAGEIIEYKNKPLTVEMFNDIVEEHFK